MFKKLFFFGASFFTVFFAWSQKPIDTMPLNQLKDSILYSIEKKASITEPYAKAYLQKASQQNNTYAIYEAYYFLGKISYHQKKHDKANEYYDLAIHTLQKEHLKHSKEFVLLLKQKGQNFLDTQQINTALTSYYQALDTINKYNLNHLKVSLTSNIAMIKSETSDFKEALRLHKQNLDFLNNVNRKTYTSYNNYDVEYIATLLNIATAYRRLQILDSAYVYNEKGLEKNQKLLAQKTAKPLHNIHQKLKGHLLTNHGIIFFHKQLFDESLHYFDLAKNIQDSLQIHSFSLECDLYKGKNYLKKSEYEKAIHFGKKAVKGFENKYQFSSTRNLLDAYLLLSNSYEKLRDYKNANHYYEKYRQRYEQVLDPQKIHALNTLENGYKAKPLIDTNKTLKRKYTNLLIVLFFAIVLFFIGYIFYKRRNKKTFDTLLLKIENLEAKTNVPKYKKATSSLPIEEKTAHIILEKLNYLEQQLFFLDKSYDMSQTAEKIGTNTSYLSATINHYKAKNFKEYMNELKINYALITLKENSLYRKYAISALASEFGYNSTLTFSRAFKKYAGITPSDYIKKLNN